MGVLTGPYAPDPPHQTSVYKWPLSERSLNQQLVSSLASPELQSRIPAVRRVMISLGLIPITWKKTATPLQVTAWFPAGSSVTWGDAGTDSPSSDGWVTHTYAAPGVYTVNVTHVANRALGEALVQV
jgi:PKD domain